MGNCLHKFETEITTPELLVKFVNEEHIVSGGSGDSSASSSAPNSITSVEPLKCLLDKRHLLTQIPDAADRSKVASKALWFIANFVTDRAGREYSLAVQDVLIDFLINVLYAQGFALESNENILRFARIISAISFLVSYRAALSATPQVASIFAECFQKAGPENAAAFMHFTSGLTNIFVANDCAKQVFYDQHVAATSNNKSTSSTSTPSFKTAAIVAFEALLQHAVNDDAPLQSQQQSAVPLPSKKKVLNEAICSFSKMMLTFATRSPFQECLSDISFVSMILDLLKNHSILLQEVTIADISKLVSNISICSEGRAAFGSHPDVVVSFVAAIQQLDHLRLEHNTHNNNNNNNNSSFTGLSHAMYGALEHLPRAVAQIVAGQEGKVAFANSVEFTTKCTSFLCEVIQESCKIREQHQHSASSSSLPPQQNPAAVVTEELRYAATYQLIHALAGIAPGTTEPSCRRTLLAPLASLFRKSESQYNITSSIVDPKTKPLFVMQVARLLTIFCANDYTYNSSITRSPEIKILFTAFVEAIVAFPENRDLIQSLTGSIANFTTSNSEGARMIAEIPGFASGIMASLKFLVKDVAVDDHHKLFANPNNRAHFHCVGALSNVMSFMKVGDHATKSFQKSVATAENTVSFLKLFALDCEFGGGRGRGQFITLFYFLVHRSEVRNACRMALAGIPRLALLQDDDENGGGKETIEDYEKKVGGSEVNIAAWITILDSLGPQQASVVQVQGVLRILTLVLTVVDATSPLQCETQLAARRLYASSASFIASLRRLENSAAGFNQYPVVQVLWEMLQKASTSPSLCLRCGNQLLRGKSSISSSSSGTARLCRTRCAECWPLPPVFIHNLLSATTSKELTEAFSLSSGSLKEEGSLELVSIATDKFESFLGGIHPSDAKDNDDNDDDGQIDSLCVAFCIFIGKCFQRPDFEAILESEQVEKLAAVLMCQVLPRLKSQNSVRELVQSVVSVVGGATGFSSTKFWRILADATIAAAFTSALAIFATQEAHGSTSASSSRIPPLCALMTLIAKVPESGMFAHPELLQQLFDVAKAPHINQNSAASIFAVLIGIAADDSHCKTILTRPEFVKEICEALEAQQQIESVMNLTTMIRNLARSEDIAKKIALSQPIVVETITRCFVRSSSILKEFRKSNQSTFVSRVSRCISGITWNNPFGQESFAKPETVEAILDVLSLVTEAEAVKDLCSGIENICLHPTGKALFTKDNRFMKILARIINPHSILFGPLEEEAEPFQLNFAQLVALERTLCYVITGLANFGDGSPIPPYIPFAHRFTDKDRSSASNNNNLAEANGILSAVKAMIASESDAGFLMLLSPELVEGIRALRKFVYVENEQQEDDHSQERKEAREKFDQVLEKISTGKNI